MRLLLGIMSEKLLEFVDILEDRGKEELASQLSRRQVNVAGQDGE